MPKYAANTTVSSSRSLEEIQRTLARYGADGFQFGYEGRKAQIGFKTLDRIVRMVIILPDPAAKEFTRTPTGKERTVDASRIEWEKASRQIWRALLLAVKSKLESVESGIETFDEAFFAHIVIPGCGRTIGQEILPSLPGILFDGDLPKLPLTME